MANFVFPNQIQIKIRLDLLVQPDTHENNGVSGLPDLWGGGGGEVVICKLPLIKSVQGPCMPGAPPPASRGPLAGAPSLHQSGRLESVHI